MVEIRLNKNNNKKKQVLKCAACILCNTVTFMDYGFFLKRPLAKQPQLFIRKCGPKEQRHNGDYKSR